MRRAIKDKLTGVLDDPRLSGKVKMINNCHNRRVF